MKNNTPTSNNNHGFTIIELMIATAIFAFILLIATTGIIRIGQLYYKGVTESKIQDNVRSVSDNVTRSIQFAKGIRTEYPTAGPIAEAPYDTDPTANPAVERFCIGDYRYTVFLDKPFKTANGNTPRANNSGLWSEKLTSGSSCACPTGCATETRQLLGENVRVLNFDLSNLGIGIDKAWHVNLRLAYGDNDLLTHYTDDGTLITDADPQKTIEFRQEATCRLGNS